MDTFVSLLPKLSTMFLSLIYMFMIFMPMKDAKIFVNEDLSLLASDQA